VSHFDIDKYAYLESPFHRFDPRAKLISVLVLIFAIVLLDDVLLLSMALLIAMTFVTISRIPLLFLLRRLRFILLFLFTVFIVLVLTVPGDYIFDFHLLHLSKEGINIATKVTLRALSVMLLVFPMIATVRFDNFIKSMESLRVPNKLVQIIAFSYRYIFVILNEFQRTMRAMESRGFKKRSNRFSLKVLGNAIGMLLIRSHERSERVYQAMCARGYSGRIKTLRKFKMTSLDWLKAASIIAIAILLHMATMIEHLEPVVA